MDLCCISELGRLFHLLHYFAIVRFRVMLWLQLRLRFVVVGGLHLTMHRTYRAIGLLSDYPNPKRPIPALTLTLPAEP